MTPNFGLLVIGDEILSGKRRDKHFEAVVGLLAARGLRLSWSHCLGDDREALSAFFRRTLAAGEIVFSCGGIGNTPDDHTRQAAAAALGVELAIHPEGLREIEARFGADALTPERRKLVAFPAGSAILPNPVNRIPGFMARGHYFVPGFPQMAHPMIEWALDRFYRPHFKAPDAVVEKTLHLTGPLAHESGLLDLMERIVADFPELRLFSLPSLHGDERRHLELGVEGAPARVDAAMDILRTEVKKRGICFEETRQEAGGRG